MKITNPIIAVGITIILLSIIVIIYFKAKKDINRYTNILIKETIISFPIGLLMLAYQMYKFGHWGLSKDMYGFVLVLFNLGSIFIILMDKLSHKFLKVRGYNVDSSYSSKYPGVLGFLIVLTPVFTIGFLIAMIFGIQ